MERMEKHRPEWRRGDSLTSIRDLGRMVLDEIANAIPINVDIKIDEVVADERTDTIPDNS
jgi:hypothetical protein